MAKNRRDIGTEAKQADIVAVARRLFLAEGYDATSMARIAAETGVAPNTLYWYFADKDALLIAVLDALLGVAVAEYESVRQQRLETQLNWLLAKLDAARNLVTTVHARLSVSKTLSAWHDGFHRLVESMMVAALTKQEVPEAEQSHIATIGIFVVEGFLSHPEMATQRTGVIRVLTESLRPGARGPRGVRYKRRSPGSAAEASTRRP